jgi:NAD(P)-dependent dehydrogenase (short-subunit alcohol dehydrogenase family)
LQKLGIKTVDLDVNDDASVAAGVKNALSEAGNIDVLVNNAGIASVGVTEAFTADQAKAIFDTNVIGLLRVTNAVLPSMRQRHDGLVIALGRADVPAVLATHSDTVEWTEAERFPYYTGTWHGPQAVLNHLLHPLMPTSLLTDLQLTHRSARSNSCAAIYQHQEIHYACNRT